MAFVGDTIGYINFIFGENLLRIIAEESLWGFFNLFISTLYMQSESQSFLILIGIFDFILQIKDRNKKKLKSYCRIHGIDI